MRATNLGTSDVPFGYAAHPYLSVGEETVDEVALTVPAASYLEVDERLLPVGDPRRWPAPRCDCRGGARAGLGHLDTAFTDLVRDADGRWRVRLRAR